MPPIRVPPDVYDDQIHSCIPNLPMYLSQVGTLSWTAVLGGQEGGQGGKDGGLQVAMNLIISHIIYHISYVIYSTIYHL